MSGVARSGAFSPLFRDPGRAGGARRSARGIYSGAIGGLGLLQTALEIGTRLPGSLPSGFDSITQLLLRAPHPLLGLNSEPTRLLLELLLRLLSALRGKQQGQAGPHQGT